MLQTRFLLPVVLPLAFLACRPPQAMPAEPPSTGAARVGAQALPEARRQDYLDGFRNGLAMVELSLKEGRKPFHLSLGQGPAPSRPLGALPEGAAILEEAPQPELDLDSGLEERKVYGDFTLPYAKGQVDGFNWALGFHRESLLQRGILRPRSRPPLPSVWTPFPASGSVSLGTGQISGEVRWAPGLLGWQTLEKGFPARRRWRPSQDWMQPRFVALEGEALWVETQDQGALALDLESGAILDRQPAQRHEGAAEGSHASYLERQRAKARTSEQKALMEDLRRRAAAGDARAMHALGREVVVDSGEPDGLAARLLWNMEAARRGHVPAMLEVAAAYYTGQGLPQDLKEARLWSEKAARTGDPSAQTALVTLFPPGGGKP